jgi:hypothetical protein
MFRKLVVEKNETFTLFSSLRIFVVPKQKGLLFSKTVELMIKFYTELISEGIKQCNTATFPFL